MWGQIRRYLNWRQIALLALTLFALPFWLLNYESILQATGLDKVFVNPEGRFMTTIHTVIAFIQSDLAKGLLAGALIVAFLPLLARLYQFLLTRYRGASSTIDVNEEAHHELKLFVTDCVIPAGCTQRDLQITIIKTVCANRTAIDLATESLLANWKVQGFGDNFSYLLRAFCSSPETPVPFNELKGRVLEMDKNYHAMLEQTDQLALDAGMDYRTHHDTKDIWETYCVCHNGLVDRYRGIKRDRRFGRLCRPGINGPWTQKMPDTLTV